MDQLAEGFRLERNIMQDTVIDQAARLHAFHEAIETIAKAVPSMHIVQEWNRNPSMIAATAFDMVQAIQHPVSVGLQMSNGKNSISLISTR